jgi:catechol 2,3-dioxygenase-like lactoylglutathione lyase family enzyme
LAAVSFPHRITYITLGARDMAALRAFYSALGWAEREGSDDAFAAYDAGALRLTLFPLGRLGAEAAPGEPQPAGGWRGVTFGLNVESAAAVDEALRATVAAGGRVSGGPAKREWGGYSGYVADPEGNRWEITWAPGYLPEAIETA